ncbi:GNAT family N-acetyltransferase [Pseudomonadota bacterium]
MPLSDIQCLCKDINQYLMKRFKYKSCPASHNRRTISAYRKQFDLYFRFRPNTEYWQTDSFVIARIGFHETRKGHGTDLLRFIVSRAVTYGIKKIGIETANENSSAFASYYGFSNFSGSHWVVDVSELQDRLSFTESSA